MPRQEDVLWDRFSMLYDRTLKKDKSAYQEMIKRILWLLKPEDQVLEVAVGTGIIAFGLADRLGKIEAVDFSSHMVTAAKKKAYRQGIFNVAFSVQDACRLNYAPHSYDFVIVCNALHIMPEPEKALAEIKRVLKRDGRMIAPTFLHAGNMKAAILSRLMFFTGFRVYHKWTQQSYQAFLEQNGFRIVDSDLIQATVPIAYAVAQPGSPINTLIKRDFICI